MNFRHWFTLFRARFQGAVTSMRTTLICEWPPPPPRIQVLHFRMNYKCPEYIHHLRIGSSLSMGICFFGLLLSLVCGARYAFGTVLCSRVWENLLSCTSAGHILTSDNLIRFVALFVNQMEVLLFQNDPQMRPGTKNEQKIAFTSFEEQTVLYSLKLREQKYSITHLFSSLFLP